ncbi:hypothetical protein [Alkalihalobacillus sp. AL-G]|uniref:hypothetical protein n=1 Tax=Alkalihalobacillus sp. AL-G TaxID=2926399 RepID=UPI00272BDCC0|nr:hypothetical protein [Alkalihalobacillus sp. AL-G]WLD94283.1 hypothetical protein MOJ78_05155 [Alkalihalobacillus sp. AL-G]
MSKPAKSTFFLVGGVILGLVFLLFVQAYELPQNSGHLFAESLVDSDLAWPGDPDPEDDPVWPDSPALVSTEDPVWPDSPDPEDDPVWPDSPALVSTEDPVWPDSPDPEDDPVWPDSPASNV